MWFTVWSQLAPMEGMVNFMWAVGGVARELLALVSVLHHGPEIIVFLPSFFPILPVLTLFPLLNAKYFFKLATSNYLSILASLLLLIVCCSHNSLVSVKTVYFTRWSLKQTNKREKKKRKDFLACFESMTLTKEASSSGLFNLLSSLMSGERSPVSKAG